MCNPVSQVDDAQARVDRLRAAADEAARFAVARFTTFLLVTVYLGIIVGTTNDEHLLRQSGLALPIFGVALPVVPFYAFIPLFYVLLHINVISQYAILAPVLDKLRAALAQLNSSEQKEEQRDLVYPSSFSHMHLRTATTLRMRLLLRMAVVVPLIALPLVLLCWIQRQFLPYHSVGITTLHRSYLLLDLLVIWVYWPPRADNEDQGCDERTSTGSAELTEEPSSRADRWFSGAARMWSHAWALARRAGGRVVYHGVRVGPTVVIVAYGLMVATVPDRTMDVFWPSARVLFPGIGNSLETKFHRNLVLREMILVEEPPAFELLGAYKVKGEDLEQAWIEHAKGLDLRLRDLRYADFSRSTLYNADFRGADLTRADLSEANLSRAKFEPYKRTGGADTATRLVEGRLSDTDLRGADLSNAMLHGADLARAELHGARMHAELYGASLYAAQLQGALLGGAALHGADLKNAVLHGANLSAASLHGADLERAELHGVDLASSSLSGANLRFAELVACDMQGADIVHATFDQVSMRHCDLRGIRDGALSESRWEKVTAQLKARLAHSPGTLKRVIERLDEALRRPTMFPPAGDDISECLVSTDAQGAEPWYARDREQFERALVDEWADLACDDSWIAEVMAQRAMAYSHMYIPYRGGMLTAQLVTRYDRAVAGEAPCEGVRQLDPSMIHRLRRDFAPLPPRARDRN